MATDQPDDGEAGERLEWTVWPAAQRPVLSVAVGLIVLGFCVAAVWSFGNPGYGLLGFVVLCVALQAHFVPTHYQLGGHEVTVRGLGGGRWNWSEVPYALDFGAMIALSPTPEPPRDRQGKRRLVLLRPEGNRAEIMAYLRTRVQIIDKRSEKARSLWP